MLRIFSSKTGHGPSSHAGSDYYRPLRDADGVQSPPPGQPSGRFNPEDTFASSIWSSLQKKWSGSSEKKEKDKDNDLTQKLLG
mgnify:CR=1 FL=1